MGHALAATPRTLADLLPVPADRTRRIAREALLIGGFAVLTAVFAQFRLHLSFTPVPITGQTFAVLLAGTTLGRWRGGLSMLVYWLAGIVSPVVWYADDKGWQAATGASAGYLFGFVLAAAAVGALAERRQDRDLLTSIPAMLMGTAIIYVCGVVWLAQSLDMPIANGQPNAIAAGLTPFLIGDALKLLLAGALAPLAWKLADTD